MLNIRIVCVGTIKESYLKEGIAEYAKRMTGKCDFRVIELKEEKVPENPSAGEISSALDKEASKILDAAKGSNDDAFISVGLNAEEYKIITENDQPKYKVRFKILEAFEKIIK